jgi:hypothetical protein
LSQLVRIRNDFFDCVGIFTCRGELNPIQILIILKYGPNIAKLMIHIT